MLVNIDNKHEKSAANTPVPKAGCDTMRTWWSEHELCLHGNGGVGGLVECEIQSEHIHVPPTYFHGLPWPSTFAI